MGHSCLLHLQKPDVALHESVEHAHFDTSGIARREQALAWRDRVAHVIDAPPSREAITQGFAGAIDRYSAGHLVFTDSRTDAMTLDRSVVRTSTDNRCDYAFHLVVEGQLGQWSGMTRKRSVPHVHQGIVAVALDQPYRIKRPACRVLSLFVPHADVAASVSDPPSLHGQMLDRASPAAAPAFAHLMALNTRLPSMDRFSAHREMQIGAALLLRAFNKQAAMHGKTRAALRSAVMERVRRYIDMNLHEAALSPSSMIGELGLKRATIYRWFDEEGGLASYIRHRRLHAAMADLVHFPHMRVVDVAYGLGFNSASDFTRAFRRAYGLSPRDARMQALARQQSATIR